MITTGCGAFMDVPPGPFFIPADTFYSGNILSPDNLLFSERTNKE
jgi:hypothetical protein